MTENLGIIEHLQLLIDTELGLFMGKLPVKPVILSVLISALSTADITEIISGSGKVLNPLS
ncbi:MAG: hypothetical protein ACTS8H_01245 [Arsenophonus sp. NC-PE1-MAG3]